MSECIFCKIIKGDIPSYKVYENDAVYAFLDITQVTKGHTLIVPKQHVSDVFEWTPDIAKAMGEAISTVSKQLQFALSDMQGLNIVNNNREIAYQSVFHSHVHLIPRYSQNDGFSMTFPSNAYTPEDMQAIANQITTTLGGNKHV